MTLYKSLSILFPGTAFMIKICFCVRKVACFNVINQIALDAHLTAIHRGGHVPSSNIILSTVPVVVDNIKQFVAVFVCL